ncbi:MAG: DUF6477 family protein [Pseudomonadota bacterium]
MDHAQNRLSRLNRPKLLVKAACIGLKEYNRNRTLQRVLQTDSVPEPGTALDAHLRHENAIDTDRRDGVIAYSPSRHIELLAAVITEARLADAVTA